MGDFKVVIEVPTGEKVWINPRQVVKMVKSVSGRYFIYLSNGETYEVDRRKASTLEDFFKELSS